MSITLVQLILNKEQTQNNLQTKHLIIQNELSKPRGKWDNLLANSRLAGAVIMQ